MPKPKTVQIPERLFWLLATYHIYDDGPDLVDHEEIRRGLEAKVEAIERREQYTKRSLSNDKTAP